jgi:hypothetical protein
MGEYYEVSFFNSQNSLFRNFPYLNNCFKTTKLIHFKSKFLTKLANIQCPRCEQEPDRHSPAKTTPLLFVVILRSLLALVAKLAYGLS